MKNMIVAIAIILACVDFAMAYNEADDAHMKGIEFGYHMGYLAKDYQAGNASARADYDNNVNIINMWMNRTGYMGERWAYLPDLANNCTLPTVFDPKNFDQIINNGLDKNIDHKIDQNVSTVTVKDSYELSENDMERANISLGTENFLSFI